MENQTPETPQSTQNGEERHLPIQTTASKEITPLIPKLTDKTKMECVSLFARGYRRPVIGDLLLETPPKELLPVIDTVPAETLRQDILSQLRSCDPTDTKFATTKYEDYYIDQRRAFQLALHAKAHQIVEQQITALDTIRKDSRTLMDQLRTMLYNASEITITGNAEFTKTASTLLAAQKVFIAAGDRQLELLKETR